MTTPMRMTPWTTTARFVLTLRNVMSVRISWRITTATIGPKTPPRPPARLTPPRTIAATLSSVYGPGTGCPDAGARGEAQAAEGREQAGEHVGEDLRPADRARRSGTPPAGCCRSHRATDRACDRRTGIQIDGDDDDQDDGRLRDPLVAERTAHELLEPRGRAAARRLEHEQRAAGPHERHRKRHDDVRHAGEDDEAAVDRAEQDADQEDGRRRRATPTASDWPFIRVAEIDAGERHHRPDREVDPARDDDDGLSDRREREGQDGDRESLDAGDAVARLDELREQEQADQEPDQADGPGVPSRRLRASRRDSRAASSGSAAVVIGRLRLARSGLDRRGLGLVRPGLVLGRRGLGGDRLGHGQLRDHGVRLQVVGGAQERRLVGIGHARSPTRRGRRRSRSPGRRPAGPP